jgi:hypothetical protein
VTVEDGDSALVGDGALASADEALGELASAGWRS